jgi:transcriptional regulator with XRE-family HTH domain
MKRVLFRRETLAEYVGRILSEKGLSFREVQRRAGRQITQAYVGAIVRGRYRNPSVDKLKALARGLGEDEEEVFRVARGLSPRKQQVDDPALPRQMVEVLQLMEKIVVAPELLDLMKQIVALSPDELKVVLQAVRLLNEFGTLEAVPSRQQLIS